MASPVGHPKDAAESAGAARSALRTREATTLPTLTILASSTLGVPPLYLATLASGAMRLPFGTFLAATFVGSVLRYAVLSVATVLARGPA
jgi:membrane protein YqaA with SNARE-associated domain